MLKFENQFWSDVFQTSDCAISLVSQTRFSKEIEHNCVEQKLSECIMCNKDTYGFHKTFVSVVCVSLCLRF